ncbi:MAG TPA: CARDB domain-containing protein [Pirellulales bacterium]|jgi:hypothetical protein
MSLLTKSLRFALMALLVGVCVAETASARDRGGRRSRKSSGGGYSSNNYNPQATLASYTPTPAPVMNPKSTDQLVPPTVVLPNSVSANSGSVDLVLEDLKMTAEATPVAGPAYAVRFRNQGTRPAGSFAVMVAASVDGSLAHDAPHGAIEIPALGPGESQEVILRLPAAATKPNAAGQSFNKLVVMIDPLDAVAEMDESNNTAVLDTI